MDIQIAIREISKGSRKANSSRNEVSSSKEKLKEYQQNEKSESYIVPD